MMLTHDAMVELHQKLVLVFTKKLAPIPRHSFFGDRKPTIDDYYKLNDAALPDHIPRFLSLPFFFVHYIIFASNGLSSCKFEGRFDIACASWFWSIDKTRLFSSRYYNVLINFLHATMVETCMWPEDTKNKEMLQFIHKFRLAFVAYNLRLPEFDDQVDFLSFWYNHTNYDLIRFSSRNIKKIVAKVNKAKDEVSAQISLEPADFLDKARLQDRAQSSQYAFVWTVKWLVKLENSFDYVEGLEKEYNATPHAVQGELSAHLAGIGMDSDIPSYLTEEHLIRSETQALLKEIENVEPADEKYSVMWMEPDVAMDRIMNSDLSAMLRNIKL